MEIMILPNRVLERGENESLMEARDFGPLTEQELQAGIRLAWTLTPVQLPEPIMAGNSPYRTGRQCNILQLFYGQYVS